MSVEKVLPVDIVQTQEDPRYQEIRSFKGVEYFQRLNEFTDQLFAEDPMFEPYRIILGSDRAQDVVNAVNTSDFNSFDPFTNTDDYKTVLAVARAKEQLKRGLILAELKRGNDLELQPYKQIVLKGFCHMADVMDDISEKWRDDVIWSPLGRAMHDLPDEEKMLLPKRLKQVGLNHAYAVIVPTGDKLVDTTKLLKGESGQGYEEVPYTVRYAAEYGTLRGILKYTSDYLADLGQATAEVEAYENYFSIWQRMCEATDAEELERTVLELDEAWMDLPDDFLVTHPMEYGYYGEDGIRKDFVTSLGMADPQKQDLLARCTQQRDAIKTYFEAEIPDRNIPSEVLKTSIQTLDKRTRFVSSTKITGSMGYDFRIAGESLPNSDHQSVTDEKGKRILIFSEGSKKSWEGRLATWQKVFGSDALHDFDGISYEDWIEYFLATHEVGESILRNQSSDERLGNYRSILNEDKATTAGVAYLGGLARVGNLSDKEAEKQAKLSMLSNIYFLSFYNSPQREPYFKQGVIETNIASEVGLLQFTEGTDEWKFDWSKSAEYLVALESHFWEHHVPLWESKSTDEATIIAIQTVDQVGKLYGRDVEVIVAEIEMAKARMGIFSRIKQEVDEAVLLNKRLPENYSELTQLYRFRTETNEAYMNISRKYKLEGWEISYQSWYEDNKAIFDSLQTDDNFAFDFFIRRIQEIFQRLQNRLESINDVNYLLTLPLEGKEALIFDITDCAKSIRRFESFAQMVKAEKEISDRIPEVVVPDIKPYLQSINQVS